MQAAARASVAAAAAASRRSLATFRSPIADVQLPRGVSYPQFVLERCEELGSSKALVCAESSRSFSYAELAEGTRRAASGMAKLGLQQRDVACLFSHNCIEYPIAMYSIMSCGGVLTTANPDYTAGELAAQLMNSGSKFLITTRDKLHVAAEAAKASGVVKEILLFDEREPGTKFFGDLLDDDGSCQPSLRSFDQAQDTAAILYSSGTTGMPKGVMLTHRNLIGNVLQCLSCISYVPDQRFLGVLPMFHVYGQVPVLAFSLRDGYQLSVMRRFDPKLFLETLQNHKLTWIHVVPPIIQFMIGHPMVHEYDLSALHTVISAAAPLTAAMEQMFRERFPHIDIGQGWGMTELSPAGALTPNSSSRWRKQKPGAAGILLPNLEMRVVSEETGCELGPNETGEFQLRGVNVMPGYFCNEEATRESFTHDGWFRTGDIGYIDNDSYMFVSDRLKELIKVKGLQVAPAELESLLLQCPHVADAGVVARPDERQGELPVAFVVLKADSHATHADISDWIAQRVAPHKRLQGGVRFVKVIPKAASGKILRKELRAMLSKEAP